MRYRIYLVDDGIVEVETFGLRITRSRKVECRDREDNWATDILFTSDIKRIADDHDRDVFVK